MFAKLTSNRVSRQARPGLRPEPVLLVAPAHANDNRVTRSPAGAARRPVLTCRWVPSEAGGLECRWFIADDEAARPADQPGEAAVAQSPAAIGAPRLALVAG